MKNEITLYTPRPAQRRLHDALKRFNVICWHRRAGKTVWAINEIIKQAVLCNKKSPQYAYIAPTYSQAKRVAWQYIKEYTQPIPGVIFNEAELRCDFLGRRIYLLGAENYQNLRGIYLDGAVLDEFGDMRPEAWQEVVRPALSDRRGWAVLMGTPRGKNHFYEALQQAAEHSDMFASTMPASQSGILPDEELEAARSMMPAAKYAREYECSFDDAENALFIRDNIISTQRAPELKRIVVAIDPAVTSNASSDESGIIVAGVDYEQQYYVLADYSGRHTPDETIKDALHAYHKHEADCIVVEVNNGGDYLKGMFANYNKTVKIRDVRATRGKQIRAEPVSALYEQGKVFHANYMPTLEDQMVTWEPGEKSPDRLDALVWAITELMRDLGRGQENYKNVGILTTGGQLGHVI